MTKLPEAVCFTAQEFDIMLQLMKEAPNFDSVRLEVVGCSGSDLRAMLDLLRLVDRRSNDELDVCFEFVDESPPVLSDGMSTGRLSCQVPSRYREWWKPVAGLVLAASSPRELFLRTGFRLDELRAVVARLPAS